MSEDAFEELRLALSKVGLSRRIMVDSMYSPDADELYAIMQAEKPKPPKQNRAARRRQAAQQRSKR